MFSREFMIRTDNRTLKETPDVLNSVGVDITTKKIIRALHSSPLGLFIE